MKLSIIVPIFNEKDNLVKLFNRIDDIFNTINYEVIFINDGSTDDTINTLKNLYDKDQNHVKVINFSRNFGKDAAIYAGIKNSSGEYTAIIDADNQQDPKYIKNAIEYLDKHENTDQIAFIPKKIKTLSRLFYFVINMLSDVKLKSGASDFRVFRENVKQAVMLVLENNRFSKGIFSWVGFETHYLNYEIDKRLSGKTKFSFRKKISYALEGIVSFSVRPLKIVGLMGISLSLLSFIYLFYIIIKTIICGAKTPGFATLASLILIATGTILTVLGLIGEYLIRTFIETKKRPIYIEKSKLGFDDTIL